MKIYIEGHFNCNLGDDLFFYTILNRYKDIEFYTCTNNEIVNNFENLHYIRYNKYINKILRILHLEKFSRKMKIIKKMDAIVLLGGSMFIESSKKMENNKYNYLKKTSIPYFIIGTNFVTEWLLSITTGRFKCISESFRLFRIANYNIC